MEVPSSSDSATSAMPTVAGPWCATCQNITASSAILHKPALACSFHHLKVTCSGPSLQPYAATHTSSTALLAQRTARAQVRK